MKIIFKSLLICSITSLLLLLNVNKNSTFCQETQKTVSAQTTISSANTTTICTADEKDKQIEYLTEKSRQLEILYKREQMWHQVRDIEDDVAQLRGLTPKTHVSFKALDKDQLRDFIQKTMKEALPDEKIKAYETVYQQLDFVRTPIDLKKLTLNIFTEQVAGLYDDKTKQLFVMSQYDIEQNLPKAILAHEMCHALQDQYFNISALPFRSETNDDLASAISAIMEGDAMVLMSDYMAKNFSFSVLGELPKYLTMDQSVLNSAPYFIQQSLLFPYIEGTNFINYARLRGGQKLRDRTFVDYPRSTEQILHPEKYFVNRDNPIPVQLDDFKKQFGNEWKNRIENVLGEASIRTLFQEEFEYKEANAASEGWGGDKYIFLENKTGDQVVYWKTTWDSQTDAKEFFDAYIKLLNKTLPSIKPEIINTDTYVFPSDKKIIEVHRNEKFVNILVTNQKTLLQKMEN